MTIPIEFEVRGRPSSVNGSSAKKATWRASVSAAGKAALAAQVMVSGSLPPHAGDVAVKIFFFPHNNQYLDIDNGLKHTIDALSVPVSPGAPAATFAPIIANDRTALRLIAERFPPIPGASLIVPVAFAATLAKALMIANGQASSAAGSAPAPEFATAIKIEAYRDNNGGLW